jgi:hypothetical protein
MLTADAIIKAMAGGAVLRCEYIAGEPVFWLWESNGLASIPIEIAVAREVTASPMVQSHTAGLLPDCPQAFTYKNGAWVMLRLYPIGRDISGNPKGYRVRNQKGTRTGSRVSRQPQFAGKWELIMGDSKRLFQEVRDKHPNASASELAELFVKALKAKRRLSKSQIAAMTELARAITELEINGDTEQAMRTLMPKGSA